MPVCEYASNCPLYTKGFCEASEPYNESICEEAQAVETALSQERRGLFQNIGTSPKNPPSLFK